MFTKADKSAPSTFVARAPSTKSDAPFFSSTKDTKATSGGGQSFFAAQPSFAVQPSTAVQASLVVQPKLEVSQPSDPLEHEADAVADEVMSASAPSAVSTGDGSVQPKDDGEGNRRQGEFMARPVLQRSALSGRIQRQEGPGGFASNMSLGDDLGGVLHAKLFSPGVPGFLQRRARGPPTDDGHTSSDFEATLASSKSAGTPMPSDLRSNMEGRFGADFGAVRIHTGANAQAMNSSIHAKAFTHGGDIYFNAGQYSPATSSGQKLIAHELTHTLQQGASRPASGASSSSPGATGTTQPKTARSIQRSPVQVARAADGAQREAAVALARAEQGLVSAKDTGPDGKRMGWERLLEYFTTVFGEDRIVSGGSAAPPGAVPEDCIKRVGETTANTKGPDGKTTLYGQKRDWMPSWCGIFAFWALNKGGIPLKKWQLGENMFPREAAYPPGHQPQAGDIAWREEFSHFALVASSSGGEVTTVNGNTAGDDNVGGQIQELTHPISHWFAFFDPASIQDGPLQSPGSGTGAVAPPVRSLEELRETLFGVNPKRDNSAPTQSHAAAPSASAAAERTTPIQNTVRNLARTAAAVAPSLGGEGGLDEEVPVEREQEAGSTSSVARAALSPASSASDGPPHTRAHGFAAANGGRGPSTPVFGVSAEPSLTLARSALPYGPPPTQQRLPQARGPPAASVMGAITKGAVQRNWLGDAFDAVADAAGEAARFVAQGLDAAKAWLLGQVRDFVAAIPGYDVLSLVLGFDPITRQERPLNGNNLLEAGLDVIPLGTLFREVLIRTGVFNDVATWLDGRLGSLRILAQDIGGRFSAFWDALTIERCGNPGAVMDDVAALLRSTITSLVDFFGESASTFLTMIKQVMIREIAAFVQAQIPQLYPLLRVALGFDPQTLETVERNGTNILDALLMVHEDGEEQRRQMMETGTYQRIVGWVDEGIEVFSQAWVDLRAAVMGLWNRVSIERLADPLGLWEEIYASFSGPILSVTRFMVRAGVEILRIIKDAVLARLSAFAEETRGYFLLKVIIGRDPFTGAVVPRTVHNLVRGFMGLMEGGEEQYQQLRESGAIDDAVARVMAAVDALGMTPESIIALFTALWRSFTIYDLARPVATFTRIVQTFGEPITRLVLFVIEILMIVAEVVLRLMGFPFDLIANIIENARQAWELIKADVPGFFKNILRAIKQGFIQFFDNIATHLLNGVVGWLMGELSDAGIPTLSDFSLQGVIGWILEVLGISMERIWEKLAEHPRVGPERVAMIRGAIDTLDGIWTFIQDVRERGMAAIWDRIQEQLTNLWDTVLDAVKNWIVEQIVRNVVTRLLSMLDPTGIMAVVNSAIAFYNAIQSFIRYLTEMLQVVNTFVEGILQLASGSIGPAADALEGALDQAMPIVIGFLANQVGLGGVGRRVGEMIERAREMVDQALTWLVNRAVDTGMNIIDRLMGRGPAGGPEPEAEEEAGAEGAPGEAAAHSAITSLAVLDEPPVELPRDAQQKEQDLADATAVLRLATAASETTEDLDDFFPRIQRRFHLTSIGYVAQGEDGLGVGLVINPTRNEPIDRLRPKGTGIAGFETSIHHHTARLNGHDVGIRMDALLGPDHPQGTAPESGQQTALMQQLPVQAAGTSTQNFYIRGHLLNGHLGGRGIAENLFPITGAANSMHEHEVESHVKRWVNDDKRWVKYTVQVLENTQLVSISSTSSGPRSKKVDATLRAEAQLQTFDNNGRLVPDGTPQIATIQSIYAGSQVSLQSAAAGAQGEARAEDRAVDPILERSGELVRLHPGIFMALQALSNINWTRMSAAIGGIPNMSATAAADLQPIWGKASSLGASADLSADLTSGERRSINVLNRFASHVAAALRNPNPTG